LRFPPPFIADFRLMIADCFVRRLAFTATLGRLPII
jgi:hypothetical protein